ncbi:hypothetical protein [Snuella lapsa]|uniref:Uncharacterized protein n=1 Tax=Snuella lapsa TaxID=870481 RepID=A0ABP6XEK0_9FLAO
MQYLFLLIALGSFFSCEEGGESNCYPEAVVPNWYAEKEIMVAYGAEFERNNYTVSNGDKLVFEYNHSGAQCDDIIDDEWGEKLTFQVELGETEFEFSNNEILLTKCFYQQYGAWVSHVKHEVEKGTIKGSKVSNKTWSITVDVEIMDLLLNDKPKQIQFTETYINVNLV